MNEYPELKNKIIFFLVNGCIVEEFKTLEQNKIRNNNKILIPIKTHFIIKIEK